MRVTKIGSVENITKISEDFAKVYRKSQERQRIISENFRRMGYLGIVTCRRRLRGVKTSLRVL